MRNYFCFGLALSSLFAVACNPPNHEHPLRDMGPSHDAATNHPDLGQVAHPDMAEQQGCPGEQVMCQGVCTDTTSDDANCGSCNAVCSGGEHCQASVCGGNRQLTGCSGLIQCMSMCGDGNCANTCVTNSTPHAQQLMQAIYTCLDTACPMNNNGVCDVNSQNYDMNACNMCVDGATQPNGQCGPQITACMNDA